MDEGRNPVSFFIARLIYDFIVSINRVDVMVTLIATVTVKEGKMEEAVKALREIVPQVRKSEPGTLSYIAHTVSGHKGKNLIIFYEKYKDEAAMNAHAAALPVTLGPLRPFLEPGMDLKTCKEII